jgi:1,4-alpha-glucan branching enzyme
VFQPLTRRNREHPANEVYVTGDFDGWKRTIQLEKEDGVFKKTVELPKEKHHYKVSLLCLRLQLQRASSTKSTAHHLGVC